jgi:hypothetical protein
MNDARTVTLIVADGVASQVPPAAKKEDFSEESAPAFLGRIVGRPKDVSLDKLKENLGRAQGDIDELLTGVKRSTVGDFQLNSIDVSLTISGEGSIGFATAGVEASITLSFGRPS